MTTPLQPAKSATDAAGDLYLSGSYIELGISAAGNFGTTGTTPSGYDQPDGNGVGLVYNQAGFGVDPNIPSIDFFTPGTPYEAFAVGYTSGGTNHSGYNYALGSNVDITPVSLTNTSSGSTLSAEWVGILNGNLRVTIDYSFGAGDLYFKTAVTLTNISGSAMDDVRYSREVDPDNTVDAGGDYATINSIAAQEPTNGASEVTAVSAAGDAYENKTGSTASILYYSTDPNSRVAEGLDFGGGLDPFGSALWAAQPAGSTTGQQDSAIAISYDGGPLAAGASTSFTYYTALTSNIAATVAAITAASSVPVLAPASDSGVKGDDITNITTPVVTGIGPAGDPVTLMDGTTVVGTGTVGADGTWSITTNPLTDGTHNLTAVFTDPTAGTLSSSPLSLTIDTTAPGAPSSLALDPASDSGVKGDGLTNVTTPVIDGTGTAGDTITLYDGTAPVGTATVAADGTWSAPTSTLSEGVHTIAATETDPAGNVSTISSGLPLTIDTTAPAAPGSLTLDPGSDSGVKGDDLTNVTTPVIDGTGAAGDTITLLDGTTAVGTATVGADGKWSITSSTLADGTHSLTATETDPVGNISSPSSSVAVKIDTTNPAPTIALALASDSGVVGDGITNDTTPTLTGTAKPGSSIVLTDSSTGSPIVLGTVVADSSGNWSYALSLPVVDGTYDITATSTDNAGNVSASSPYALTIDTVAPTAPTGLTLDPASDSGAKGDGLTKVASPVITGAGAAGDTITLLDGSTPVGTATVGADGTWSITSSPLADGSHDLTATETDPAGNVSTASTGLPLTIDTSEPAPSSLTLDPSSDSGVKGDGVTSVTTPVIDGTGVAGDTVTLLDGSTVIGTTTVGADGTWSVTTGPLVGGSHDLTATETDAAGNVSPATDPLALTIDTSAPAAPTDLALDPGSDTGIKGDNITGNQTPTLTGTAEAGSTVTIYDGSGPDAVVLGTTTVGTNGQWRFTPTTPLTTGTHDLTAMTTDAAGNQSGPSSALALTIDIPAAPTGLGLAPASDSGELGDGVTNDTRPTLVGSAAPGSNVTISSNLGVIGTVTADASGNWSYTYGLPVHDGTYSITATSTDAAGNVSVPSAPFSLTIETGTPPAPSGLSLDPDSDSGVKGDGVTNITTPVIDGTGTVGDTITLFDSETAVGTASVGADGTWSVATSPLADGTHDLTAIQTDAAGNGGPVSDGLTLTIDTAEPSAPASLTLDPASDSGVPGDDITSVTTPRIDGSGTVGDTITLFDGETAVGRATVGADGAWSVTTSPLADGTHTLTATQTDAVGNSSPASSVLALTIESTASSAPAGLTLDPASDSGVRGDNITNIATPVIDGTGQAGDTITLLDGSTAVGTATVGANGAWSLMTSRLADGAHDLTAIQTDVAGNTSPASGSVAVTIDTTAPAVNAALEGSGGGRTGILAGTGDPNTTVTITDGGSVVGTAMADVGGNWQFDPSALAPGSYALVASETDAAGNTGSSSAVSLSLPDRFDLTNTTTSESSSSYGADYTGPVNYLGADYIYAGTDNINIAARVANVFIHGGSGNDALAAYAGSNVLDGGTGSNWLVGATGADGGTDTFFLDGRGGQDTWDTLLNFHAGDMLTLWGFDPNSSTLSWLDNQGTSGYLGATMKVDFGNSGVSTLVTFAGLSTSGAQFQTSTGTSDGVQYLAITRLS